VRPRPTWAGGDINGAGTVDLDTANLVAVGDISLTNAANDFGTVTLSATNATLVDANSIELGDSAIGATLDVEALSGTITVSGVVAAGSTVKLIADNMHLAGGTISSTAGNVYLRPYGVSQNIAIGVGATDNATTLGLTDVEINTVTTDASHAIIIGDMTISGTISVVGALDLTTGGSSNLSLETGNTTASAITDGTAGAGGNLITGTNLTFKAAGSIDVSVATSVVAAQSTTAGSIRIDELNAVTVGAFNGVTGITTANGGVTLVAGGTITLTDSIGGGSGGAVVVTSSAGQINDNADDAVADITTTGAVTLSATTGIGVSSGSVDLEVGTVTSATSAIGGVNLNLLDTDNSGVTVTSITATTSGDITVESTEGGDGSSTFTFATVTAANGNIAISATEGNITARAISTATAGRTIAITLSEADKLLTHDSGTIATTNGQITLTAGDIELGSTVNSGSAATTIIDSDGDGIGLGATTVSGGLNLTGTELQRITATGLTLQTPGSITVTGITAAQSNNISGTTTLAAGVDITFATTASTFNALYADAGDNVIVNAAVITDTGAIVIDAASSSTGAIQLGANVTAQTSVYFTDDVLLTNDVRLTAGTTMTFHDVVNGSEDLILDVAGTATFEAAVGGTSRIGDGIGEALVIDSAGTTVFMDSLRTSSGISQYNDSGAITFQGDVNLLAGDTSSTFYANVTLDGMTFTSARDVRFGNASTDTLTLAGGEVGIVTTGSGSTLRVAAKVDGAANLTLNTSDSATFSAAVGSTTPIGSGTGAALTVNSVFPATTTFENTLATASGIVQANNAGQIVFKENVTIGAGDTASLFHANLKLDGMTLTSAGNITFGDDSSDQVLLSSGAVVVSTATAGRDIVFNAEVYGPQALTVNSGTGSTVFNAAVGGSGSLSSLTTDAGGTTYINGGVVTTSGDQTFNDAVVLGADATLTGTNVTFASTVDDDASSSTSSDLTVNASGTTRFSGPVGSYSPIDSITTDAAGTTQINGSVSTSGGTMLFNDDVVLTASVELTDTGSTGITFAKTVSGDHDLTLNATATTLFQGAVTIGDGFGATLDVKSAGTTTFDSTVTLASGITQRAGTGMITFRDNVIIQEGNTATTFNGSVTLDGLTFTSERDVIFGDASTDAVVLSGGAVQISTVTTGVLSGEAVTGGPIMFHATIDGGQDLVLSSTGAIGLNAAVGGTTAVQSLTLTAKGALEVAHNITATTGVTLTVLENDTFVGGDNIAVSGTAQITAGGNVVLRAGDNVSLTSGSPINAGGTVQIVADYGDNDENAATVTTVTIQGTITGTSVTVSGGPDADTFNVSVSGASGITIDGAASGDTYAVAMGGLTGAVTISDTGTSGTDTATISGTSDADAFDITASAVVLGSKQVNYSSSLESLGVQGGTGADSFAVTPSTVTVIAINGGDPTTWVGDSLTYRGKGSASGGTITQTGFANVTYTNIEDIAPMVNAGADVTIQPSTEINRTVSFNDPGSTSWTATVNWGDGNGTQSLGSVSSGFTLTGPTGGYATDGTYTVTVAIYDENSLVGEDAFVVTVSNVLPPPTVTGVYVSGSAWAADFLSHVDTTGLGYAIPVGSGDQLLTLPWTNLNRITITFSENVDVDSDDLVLKGVNVATYAIASFAYNATTYVATWTLSTVIRADKLLIDLDGDGTDPVVGATSGVALDGEWVNGSDTYATVGDGTAGGDFEFRINVLPGDVNQDGDVYVDDVIAVRNAQFSNPGGANYSIFKNVDGSSRYGTFPFEILVNDVLAVRNLQFTTLPVGTPAGAPVPVGMEVSATVLNTAGVGESVLASDDGMASLQSPAADATTGLADVSTGAAARAEDASGFTNAVATEAFQVKMVYADWDVSLLQSVVFAADVTGFSNVSGANLLAVGNATGRAGVDPWASAGLFAADRPFAAFWNDSVQLDYVDGIGDELPTRLLLGSSLAKLFASDELVMSTGQDLAILNAWEERVTDENAEADSLANDLARWQFGDRTQHESVIDNLLANEDSFIDDNLFGGHQAE